MDVKSCDFWLVSHFVSERRL